MISNTAIPTPCRSSQRRWLRGFGWMIGLGALGGCKASPPDATVAVVAVAQDAAAASAQPEKARMWMTVGERRFAITLADTGAARAFAARVPLTLDMADLNGNEKHADLPQALPAAASRPGTIHNGDLMLYGSNTVVVFYQTFRSPYSYTRLGRVDDPDDLHQVLGLGSSRVMFSER